MKATKAILRGEFIAIIYTYIRKIKEPTRRTIK